MSLRKESTSLSYQPVIESDDLITGGQREKDDKLVRILAAVAISAILILALTKPNEATTAIQAARTWVTRYFSWHFIALASILLTFCLITGFTQVGSIRLGGKNARPEYNRFAWYSMLFACGQGIGLIFWSLAEPILVQHDNPLSASHPTESYDAALAWTYFHWAITAWGIYCAVALCIAYSMHNRQKKPSFRGACEDLFPRKSQRGMGIAIEFVAIITTVLGISTSFGFASLQFTSGFAAVTGIDSSKMLQVIVILVVGAIGAISVYFGVKKGMKRISEANSILSILLVTLVFLFGPTLYLLHLVPESIGTYIDLFIPMSALNDPQLVAEGISSWKDSWNGWWTVFIWCWCIAFSPFVASFIASISKGRTLREFVLGVVGVPSLIVIIWCGIIGGAGLYYDEQSGGLISKDVQADASSGLFTMGDMIPYMGPFIVIISTILVATYFITSLDSGVHALSSFVSMGARPSAFFRVVLVVMIVGISLMLLTLGGDRALDTIQTGTIIGALPFSIIIILMIVNFIRRVYQDTHQDNESSRNKIKGDITHGKNC